DANQRRTAPRVIFADFLGAAVSIALADRRPFARSFRRFRARIGVPKAARFEPRRTVRRTRAEGRLRARRAAQAIVANRTLRAIAVANAFRDRARARRRAAVLRQNLSTTEWPSATEPTRSRASTKCGSLKVVFV